MLTFTLTLTLLPCQGCQACCQGPVNDLNTEIGKALDKPLPVPMPFYYGVDTLSRPVLWCVWQGLDQISLPCQWCPIAWRVQSTVTLAFTSV